MPPKRKFNSLEEYWDVVDMGFKSPCWLWKLKLTHNGYGHYNQYGRSPVNAHVFVFKYFGGKIPKGYQLDHYLCKIRHCVNPEHLRPATREENMRSAGNTILTKEQVIEIKKIPIYGPNKVPATKVAIEYGVTEHCILDIRNGRSWRNV